MSVWLGLWSRMVNVTVFDCGSRWGSTSSCPCFQNKETWLRKKDFVWLDHSEERSPPADTIMILEYTSLVRPRLWPSEKEKTEEQGPKEWIVSEPYLERMKGGTREHGLFMIYLLREGKEKRDQVLRWSGLYSYFFETVQSASKYVH